MSTRLLVFGGRFDPPHKGHIESLTSAVDTLNPDRTFVVPSHAAYKHGQGSTDEERMRLCKLAFEPIPGVTVSDIELSGKSVSDTSSTLCALREEYPGAELFFLVGSDVLPRLIECETFRHVLPLCTLTVSERSGSDGIACAEQLTERFGAKITRIPGQPSAADSTLLRSLLSQRLGREFLSDSVYAEIIRLRLYGAQPELLWLREQVDRYLKPTRIPHVRGCEAEAIRMAERWGVEPDLAAEAGILHDVTKKLEYSEQLHLCERYGIILDAAEREEPKLLHARTGAYFAREVFGVSDSVFSAIEWHTTGRENMTVLEKIVYLADMIEPSRTFPGVDELRALAYSDLDAAMICGLTMSLSAVESHGAIPHERTKAALAYFLLKGKI